MKAIIGFQKSSNKGHLEVVVVVLYKAAVKVCVIFWVSESGVGGFLFLRLLFLGIIFTSSLVLNLRKNLFHGFMLIYVVLGLNLISVFGLVDFKIEIFYFCFLWMGVLYQVLIFLYFAVRG